MRCGAIASSSEPAGPTDRPDGAGALPGLIASATIGFCAFISIFAPQPLLPLFERLFQASKAQVAWTMSATTIAVALCSPFIGAVADRVGRRRLIVLSFFAMAVPTGLVATASSIGEMVAWRFVQGALLPGAYAIALAYIGEAFQGGGVGRAMAALVTGSVVGGFSGRLIAGLTAQSLGWRSSFLTLAALTALGGVASARLLPARQAPTSSRSQPLRALRALAARLDGRLAVTYVVAFNVFFTQSAILTYVTFHLAEPPYHLSVAQLSWIFVVYLFGAAVTPLSGRWIDRLGSRRTLATAVGTALCGACLTLVPSIAVVVLGLAVCCTAAFVSQSAATSFLQIAAPHDLRSTASGVYVSCYYLGGCVGGVVPAAAWHVGGWTGVIVLVAFVQLATLAIALRYWR